MKKTKSSKAIPTLAQKVMTALKRAQKNKVIDLAAFKAAKQVAAAQHLDMPALNHTSDAHPSFGVYALAQNQLSNLIEILAEMKELSKFVNLILKAEEEYMPQGPPMSPITGAHFTSWSGFDLALGPHRESLVDVAGPIGLWAGLHPSYGPLFNHFSRSRLGLYRNEGADGCLVRLTEVGTDETVVAAVSSGDVGSKGDLWLTRLLPPIDAHPDVFVVFATPYQVLGLESEWLAFFERSYARTKRKTRQEAHDFLLKYGLSHFYWLEYLMQAYVNHTPHLVFLKGLPDVPQSLPHLHMKSLQQYGLV